jgi:hypothetical protein
MPGSRHDNAPTALISKTSSECCAALAGPCGTLESRRGVISLVLNSAPCFAKHEPWSVSQSNRAEAVVRSSRGSKHRRRRHRHAAAAVVSDRRGRSDGFAGETTREGGWRWRTRTS